MKFSIGLIATTILITSNIVYSKPDSEIAFADATETTKCAELNDHIQIVQQRLKYVDDITPINGMKEVLQNSAMVVWHPTGTPSMLLYIPLYDLDRKINDQFGEKEDLASKSIKFAVRSASLGLGTMLYPAGFAINFSFFSGILSYQLTRKSYDQIVLMHLEKRYQEQCE